jgi:hypothetical protein
MNDFRLVRYALAVCAAVATLAGCDESQSQSGQPAFTQDGAYPKPVRDSKNRAGGIEWNFTVRTLAAFQTATIVAYCDSKSTVTGGGWDGESTNRNHLDVTQDHSGNRFDSWAVTIDNDSSTKAIVRVYAGCLAST